MDKLLISLIIVFFILLVSNFYVAYYNKNYIKTFTAEEYFSNKNVVDLTIKPNIRPLASEELIYRLYQETLDNKISLEEVKNSEKNIQTVFKQKRSADQNNFKKYEMENTKRMINHKNDASINAINYSTELDGYS